MNTIPDQDWLNWRKRLGRKFSRHPLEIIQWEATRNCDMNCRHCGSPKEDACDQKQLTTSEIIEAFREIKRFRKRIKFAAITGGEPFLRADLFEILSEISSLKWTSTIQTNGNWLAQKPEKIFDLLQLGVRGIGVDLDGTEALHDKLRNRPGHYRQTTALLEKLLAHSDVLHVTITTVVNKENIECLPGLLKTIKKINPHRWRLLPLEKIGRSRGDDLTLDASGYNSLLHFVSRRNILDVFSQDKTQLELGCMGWLGKEFEGIVRPYVWSCIAGRTCLGILHDGSLSACAHIDRSFIQGNVRTDSICDVWEKGYQIFRKRPEQEMCLGCGEKKLCTLPMHKLGSDGKLCGCVHKIRQERG